MNSEAFARSIDELYERLRALTASKGEEYKRREDNQFANFERGAASLGLTREQVLMVYLSKHLDSITTYVKDRAAGQEKQYAEPISGRIDDAILYLLLLRGMATENECRFNNVENFGGAELIPAPGVTSEGQARRVAMRDLQVQFSPVDELPRYAIECPVDFSAVKPDPVHAAFEQMAVPATRTMEVGGVTTARRTIEVGAPDVVIMSSNQTDAIAECNARGLPVGTCALMYPDQLYGRKGGHVIFIHHGTRTDDAMADEVRRKCESQGLGFELLAK